MKFTFTLLFTLVYLISFSQTIFIKNDCTVDSKGEPMIFQLDFYAFDSTCDKNSYKGFFNSFGYAEIIWEQDKWVLYAWETSEQANSINFVYTSEVSSIINPPGEEIGNWQEIAGECGKLQISGNGLQQGIQLPLTITAFNAVKMPNSVYLYWSTEKENKTIRFEIETSNNATEFQTIAHVPAKQGITNYEYEYFHPQAKNMFFRLKQVDSDGSYFYSEIVSIINTDHSYGYVYPNPSSQRMVHIDLYAAKKNIVTSGIYDMNGNLLESQIHNLLEGSNKLSFNMQEYSEGMYLFKVGHDVSQKVILTQ